MKHTNSKDTAPEDPKVKVFNRIIGLTQIIRKNGSPAEAIIAAQVEQNLSEQLRNCVELKKAA